MGNMLKDIEILDKKDVYYTHASAGPVSEIVFVENKIEIYYDDKFLDDTCKDIEQRIVPTLLRFAELARKKRKKA